MKPSKSQKLLKVFSVIQFLNGLVFILLLVLFLFALQNETFMEQVKISKTEFIVSAIELLVNAVILFISAYILNKTSKDPSKHNSALTITLIVIAYEIINFITNLDIGVPRNLATMVFTVIMNLIILAPISKVKEEYEQSIKE